MEKIYLFFFLLLIYTSATLYAQENVLLPDEQLIAYGVFLNDSVPDLYNDLLVQNQQHTKKFVGQIFTQKALNGEVKAYNANLQLAYYPYGIFNSKQIDPMEIITKMDGSIDSLTANELIKNNEKIPNINQINSLLFVENWILAPKGFKLEKQIKAVVPVRHFFKDFGQSENTATLKKTFRLLFPEKPCWIRQLFINRRMKLCNSVEYEFLLGSYFEPLYNWDTKYEKNGAPFFSTYSRRKFTEQLVNYALSKKAKVLDYYSHTKIDKKEIRQRLGGGNDTILIKNYFGKDEQVIVESPLAYDNIKSIIFIEDWFYDHKTLRMKKEINGIAPVFHYKENNELKKRIAFIVYFN